MWLLTPHERYLRQDGRGIGGVNFAPVHEDSTKFYEVDQVLHQAGFVLIGEPGWPAGRAQSADAWYVRTVQAKRGNAAGVPTFSRRGVAHHQALGSLLTFPWAFHGARRRGPGSRG